MLGLFNKKNYWRTGVQAFNLLALTWATYDLITNPEANYLESGSEMAINMVSFLSLRENVDALTDFGASLLNAFEIGVIYQAVTSGDPSSTASIRAIQAFNHLLTIGATLLPSGGNDLNEEYQKQAQKTL